MASRLVPVMALVFSLQAFGAPALHGQSIGSKLSTTIVGEIIGRRLSELSVVDDVYEPHVTTAGVETMRWLPSERGVHTTFLVTGAKWNISKSLLVNNSVLIRVTDAGLRSRFTPTIAIDYAFER